MAYVRQENLVKLHFLFLVVKIFRPKKQHSNKVLPFRNSEKELR